MLDLVYARSLYTYYRAYSWEINSRERVETAEEIDLKSWTRDQIQAEAWRSLLRVWKDRERLAGHTVRDFPDIWSPGDYPAGIRDTLRDAVVYLMARVLQDSGLWTPAQSNEVHGLDLAGLLADPPPTKKAIEAAQAVLGSPEAHPLEKIAALLSEHERWCLGVSPSRPEAAMEARFERFSALHEAFTQEDDRALIRARLAAFLSASGRGKLPWWAMGQALLAEFTRAEDAPDALVRARALAQEGARRHPQSPGGKRCLHIVASIEAPDYSVEAMQADSPGRRSIRVTHRNVERIFFRAYSLDIREIIRTSKDYSLLPRWEEAKKLVDKLRPAAAWREELPATVDYRDHRTFSRLPEGLPSGLYLVSASPREDFAARRNRVQALYVVAGDLVLLKSGRAETPGQATALVLSGSQGRPVEGAEVELYSRDWQTGHSRVDLRTTDRDGLVRFAPRSEGRSYFLLASHGDDIAIDHDEFSHYGRTTPDETSAALVFTDRSIYRPGQKIFWKVVAYRGRRDLGQLRPAAGASASVWLEDSNGRRVAEAVRSTNTFGTASGEFAIPVSGRPLGAWRLRTSPQGQALVRVEEYKRPTFEVKVKDPETSLRLNRPATLKGEARYYFGLPVSSGTVAWQVRREPVYPRWWWWGREPDSGRIQVVAGGTSALGEDGMFEAAFTPKADERRARPGSGLTYRYVLSVDVTDEGGETRSASRSFRLGFVSVEARIEAERGFYRSGSASAFKVTLADLDGAPKRGRGTWRVVRLLGPEATLLPADQPLPEPLADAPGGKKPFETPGDRLRPRWGPGPGAEDILRLWKDGAPAAKGAVEHDIRGQAAVTVPPLEPGAYRLIYETKDDFGALCRESREFLVTAATGAPAALALPLVLSAEQASVTVGKTARFFVHGGWAGQPLLLETFKGGELQGRRWLEAGKDSGILEVPVAEEDRGGFSVQVTALRDHQAMTAQADVFVPWDNKELDISFSSFRDKLAPGDRETWRVTVKGPGGKPAGQGAAELLAYMYDRSLDLFAPHRPPRLGGLYPIRTGAASWDATLGLAPEAFTEDSEWVTDLPYPEFNADDLKFLSGYGIGGPGGRGRPLDGVMPAVARQAKLVDATEQDKGAVIGGVVGGVLGGVVGEVEEAAPEAEPDRGRDEPVPLRSDFSETAFWEPHLLTGPDGSAAIEFTVPDSVTGWRVFVHGLTKDLAGGTLEKEAQTVKDLMVRPYLPRFFREGDRAELRVAVNNAGGKDLSGQVSLEVFDPLTSENLASAFGLPEKVPARPFTVKAESGTTVVFPLSAPARVGTVAFKVTAKAGAFSDGELRPLPVLPGRMHLVQSRFATLKEGAPRELRFADLANSDDPTLVNEQLVVTVDAQLFYGLLEALPYLVNYPYECTEQTLNRFLSTGILTSLYDRYPAVGKMAAALSQRETRLETFDAADPNRKMALEESPWIVAAQGGSDGGTGVERVLDPRVAEAQRETSLAKLLKAQTSNGAFPWWPGGPPSPYMTLYIVHGFSKAAEFGVAVPKEPVVRAFRYLHAHFLDEVVRTFMAKDTGWESVTFLNYTVGNFPDVSWTGGVFTAAERKAMLDFSFKHWKEHSPYLKGFLALTLKRAGRPKDAALVWDSVMDSAKTTVDEGTSWAPEDRGWLWYNDRIETHAFALRALMELQPKDVRSEGLVQWLFLNKKLNHWKSTRATSEVLYSVAYFLKTTGALGARESVLVDACNVKTDFTFEPDKYTGKKNQVVIAGDKLGPECAAVRVSKTGKGLAFASATWHFSTEKMPERGDGDLFAVDRSYFKREKKGSETVLAPLADGTELSVGDEIEVHLSIRARHPAEYVHLRDPRPSGCEPVSLTSGYRWDLGLVRYEEVRDSGMNFFMERLPQGEYTLKHRLRCAMAGTFKAAPATLQSLYAPEFAAYSSGRLVTIR
ncbi:MAG: alpha-2-macroglobulin family protein [Candidatus Aminicenantes bacterium]